MSQDENSIPGVSMLDVMRGIRRRKWMIVAIVLISFLGGLVFLKTSTTVYTTEALLLLENLSSPYEGPQALPASGNELIDSRVLQTQISVMTSNSVAARVIQELKTKGYEEYKDVPTPEVSLKLNETEKNGALTDELSIARTDEEEGALELFASGLKVYALPEANVIAIKYTSPNPKLAADSANGLASTYITLTAENKARPTIRARDWLARQIEALRVKVSTSESEIEKFRTEAGLIKGSGTTLNTQELTDLNAQITVAETARIDAQTRAAAIKAMLASKGTVDESIDVLNAPAIQRLRDQQTIAMRRVAELATVYLPNHPRMIAAQSDLRNINIQLREEALRVVDGLLEQAKFAEERQNSIIKKLDQLKSKESTANLDDVKLRTMERETAADKALLEALLLRYADASVRQDASEEPGAGRIIQRALTPLSPSFPKAGPILLLATFGGLAFSLGIAFTLEIMAATSRLTKQLAKSENDQYSDHKAEIAIPVLPSLTEAITSPTVAAAPAETASPPPGPTLHPNSARISQPVAQTAVSQNIAQFVPPSGDIALPLTLEKAKHILSHDTDKSAQALRTVEEQISRELAATSNTKRSKVITIISIGGNAFDTTILTAGLARQLATTGHKTVMVDLGAQGAELELILGLAQNSGLTDLLAGTVDFTRVVLRDPMSSAHVLPIGTQRTATIMTQLNGRFRAILQSLENIFPFVIINSGEISQLTPQLVAASEAVFMLVAPNRILDAQNAIAAMKKSGITNITYYTLSRI